MNLPDNPESSSVGGSLAITGGRVFTPEGPIAADLEIREGTIVGIGTGTTGDTTIDARGLSVVPGFIDLQINGGFGHDFTNDPSTIWDVGRRLPETGVTAFLPTIITSPPRSVEQAMRVLDAGPPPGYVGAVPLGLHLEGPFLSPRRPGVHRLDLLRTPESAEVETWTPERHVRLVTLAPELSGGLELVENLADRGVVVSVGHSDASYDEGLAAFDAGASVGTHLFNAMPPLHHREPGLVAALLTDPRPVVSVVVDGFHVHPAVVEIVWAVKGPERFLLVTDAMAAMGSPPGTYPLTDLEVTVDDRGPRDSAGRLAGSALAFDAAVRNLVEFTGSSLSDALRAGTTTPAALLGDPTRGRLQVGARADLTLLDDRLRVVATLVAGQVAHVSVDPAPGGEGRAR